MSPPLVSTKMIACLPYEEGAYPDHLLETVVRHFQGRGLRIAGVIQHDTTRHDRSRCDMTLEDLATGILIGLSEDRGTAARGCRIDQNGLMQAASLIENALDQGGIDLLVINKFGKIESEGGGLREVIADAVAQGIPVVIGVPMRNLDAWNAFAGSFSEVLIPGLSAAKEWIEGHLVTKCLDPVRAKRLRAPRPERRQSAAS